MRRLALAVMALLLLALGGCSVLLPSQYTQISPHSAAQTREAVVKMAQMCVKGCIAVCSGEKWPYVADKSVYEHSIWKDR